MLPLSNELLSVIVGLIVAIMGVLIVVFPYSTPETIQWLGIKKAANIARGLGVLTLFLGTAISIFVIAA